jgi:hypothetical protein
MKLPADQPPPARPKLTGAARRAWAKERLKIIRRRMLIGRAWSERDLTSATKIGAAPEMPASSTRPSNSAA